MMYSFLWLVSSNLLFIDMCLFSPPLCFFSVQCVKILNVRPYHYAGLVYQGQALGRLKPHQGRPLGVPFHVEMQMCDQFDPTPFI